MNSIGYNIKLTFFGESHGHYMGVVLDNLPAGIKIDYELINFNLAKRRPDPKINTPRVELDKYEIISGVFNGYSTGAAMTIIVENTNTKSSDYSETRFVPRPSQADYPAFIKYKGNNDYRGSGIFSGRLTALWVIVGAISEQLLLRKNIILGSHIKSIKDIYDESLNYNDIKEETLLTLNKQKFPLINQNKKQDFIDLIEETKNDENSVGGIIESAIINVPVGLGEPLFLSVESYLAHLLYSVPSVKGIEFGEGFQITKHFGSEMNDQYEYTNENVHLLSNNNGGILGGITTGAPIIVKCAIKPTPSISKIQKSVNLKTKTNVELKIDGRHDPQIVSRVVHVINSVLNFAILDLLLFKVNKDELI